LHAGRRHSKIAYSSEQPRFPLQAMSAARLMALTPATAGHAVMGEDCATLAEQGTSKIKNF